MTPERDLGLEHDVAAAILDGEDIDWAEAAAVAGTGAAPLLQNLRSIERISRAARPDTPVPSPGPTTIALRPASWLSTLLIVVSAAQVGTGLFGLTRRGGIGAPGITLAIFAVVAMWLMIGGLRDRRARQLAIFYLLVAGTFAHQYLGLAGSYAGRVLGAICPDAFLPLYLWRFVRLFPRSIRFSPADRWCAIGERISFVAGHVLLLTHLVHASTGDPWTASLSRSHPSGVFWIIVAGLTVPAIPIPWIRGQLVEGAERRRLRLFTGAILVGLGPAFLEILAELIIPRFNAYMLQPGVRARYTPLFFSALLLLPVGTAYAVLVDGALSVRVAVGRGLRYAFARSTIAATGLAPVAALAIYGYLHRDWPLETLLAGPRLMLLVVLTSASLVMWKIRAHILRYIDERLVRTTNLSASRLTGLVTAVRNSRSARELSDVLERGLTEPLHVPRLATLLARDVDAPFEHQGTPPWCGPLDRHSALEALLGADVQPVAVDPGLISSCYALLPAADQDWVLENNVALLVPIAGSADTRHGALAICPKHDDAPFSAEEREALVLVANAVALVMEARLLVEPTSLSENPHGHGDEPAIECVTCGAVSAAHDPVCGCAQARRTAALPLRLAGKFELERRVGAGGMGVVYQATDTTLNRPVALKTLPRLSQTAAAGLSQEARMMASVVHPNLATIYGLERWRRTPILVVEYLEGETLHARLRHERMDVPDVIRLGLLLAPALEQLHAASLLHRDIKPSNIGFTKDGIPKLLDFGLASLVEAREADRPEQDASADVSDGRLVDGDPEHLQSVVCHGGPIAGTPLYLSPEAASGEVAHHDFDVWALSLVLYECIAGEHPFRAPTVSGVLKHVRRAAVPPLPTYRPDCHPAVTQAFAGLLAPSRPQRPRSALELRNRLELVLRALS